MCCCLYLLFISCSSSRCALCLLHSVLKPRRFTQNQPSGSAPITPHTCGWSAHFLQRIYPPAVRHPPHLSVYFSDCNFPASTLHLLPALFISASTFQFRLHQPTGHQVTSPPSRCCSSQGSNQTQPFVSSGARLWPFKHLQQSELTVNSRNSLKCRGTHTYM